MMDHHVILVDDQDREIGVEEKLNAHRLGLLHRAFSIFVFNSKRELLLQKRAGSKYHSENLWTNTCCSHPRPGEDILSAARRRLMEEMGFACELKEIFSFQYKVIVSNQLVENEMDHVLVGRYDGIPKPNPDEVADYAWVDVTELTKRLKTHPEDFTYWFRKSFERAAAYFLDPGGKYS